MNSFRNTRFTRGAALMAAIVLVALLWAPAAIAGKKKSVAHYEMADIPVLPGTSSITARLNVAVDDLSVPAMDRKARVTLLLFNSGGEVDVALCPTLNFAGADVSLQGYTYSAGDGTPDCTALFTHNPAISPSLDEMQAAPLCPAPAPVLGDIVTVPPAAGIEPGTLVLVYDVPLSAVGIGLETLSPADARAALLGGGGTRLESLSGFAPGVLSLVCPSGPLAFLSAPPAPEVATSDASAWYQTALPVVPTATLKTSLSSAKTFGAAADTTAKVQLDWTDNLPVPLSGHLTHTPPLATDFTLTKATFFQGDLTATFPPDLPEGFVGQATAIVTDSSSGAELARSIHLFAKDTTPPSITAASTVRSADDVAVSLEAADAGSGLNAAWLTPSLNGVPEPAGLMNLVSGNFAGPTSFASTIGPVLSTDRVGAAASVADELANGFMANLPVAGAGPDQILECDSFLGAHVTLDGALSSVPPEAATTFTWSNGFGTALGQTADVVLPLGSHDILLTLLDARGFTGTDGMRITVVDTTPPVIQSIDLPVSCLWPPQHKYVKFALGTDVIVNAVDLCDATLHARILNVTSNQPDNGLGDGNSTSDVLFGEGGACLRAERTGRGGEDRIYTVTVEVSDDSGNSTTGSTQIRVAHDQRNHNCPALDPASFLGDGDPACSPAGLALPEEPDPGTGIDNGGGTGTDPGGNPGEPPTKKELKQLKKEAARAAKLAKKAAKGK